MAISKKQRMILKLEGVIVESRGYLIGAGSDARQVAIDVVEALEREKDDLIMDGLRIVRGLLRQEPGASERAERFIKDNK